MSRRWTNEKLDRLLGRGGVGATRRDAIIETILARVKSEGPARSRWRWSFVGLGAVAASAAGLVLFAPRLSQPDPSLFRAKSASTKPVPPPAVAVDCLGATPKSCPRGSLLVVRVTGARGYVSAWAEPQGGGERIWYFSAETFSPLVDAGSVTPTEATRAVKVGPEHVVGTYAVEIRLTDRPMNREDLLRLPAGAALVTKRMNLDITLP